MSVGHPERTTRPADRVVERALDARPARLDSRDSRDRDSRDRDSRDSSAGSAGAARRSPLSSGGGRLAQIDALRVLSCFSVVAVHALGAPYSPDVVGVGVTSFLLHYSREI
ncbi:MAG TPA: hypothetical protein VGH89_06895, partial [Pseudonocardia sp.]